MHEPGFRLLPIYWPQPSLFDFQVIIIFLLGVVALVTFLGWWEVNVERRRRHRIMHHAALGHSRENDLTEAEERLWLEIVHIAGEVPSRFVFEHITEVMVKKGRSPELVRSLRSKIGFDDSRRSGHVSGTKDIPQGTDMTLTTESHAWHAGVLRTDDSGVVLKVPEDALAYLKPGTPVKASFWRVDDARYFFTTQIASASMGSPEVTLLHANSVERFEDRDFYRASVDWRVPVTRYPKSLAGPRESFVLHVKDISAGGFSGAPEMALHAGDRILANLPLTGAPGGFNAHARIVDSSAGMVRAEFLSLTLSEQDLVHREVLRQRRQHRTPAV